MFEVKLSSCLLLRKILDSVKDLVEESITIRYDENGISMQSLDTAHVSLVEMKIGKEGFLRFQVDVADSITLYIKELLKVFKCADVEDALTILVVDADSAIFRFESKKRDKVSEHELKLIENTAEVMSVPNAKYSVMVRLLSVEFAKICKDLKQFGHSLQIVCKAKDEVTFQTEGLSSKNKIVLKNLNTMIAKSFIQKWEKSVSLTYQLNYLTRFMAGVNLANQIDIGMSDDVPLRLEYLMTEHPHVTLRFFLAPKISSDLEDDV